MVIAVMGYLFPSLLISGGFLNIPSVFSNASNAEVGIVAIIFFCTAIILYCIPDNKK
jgi:hypothetical protein